MSLAHRSRRPSRKSTTGPWSSSAAGGSRERVGNVLVLIAQGRRGGVEHLLWGDRHRGAGGIVELKDLTEPDSVGWVLVRRIAAQPDLPQPIDIRVMQPKYGVKPGGIEGAHPPRRSSDIAMHGVVR